MQAHLSMDIFFDKYIENFGEICDKLKKFTSESYHLEIIKKMYILNA